MNILIFIFCVLYFILAFRRPDWAVMFLIASLPAYLVRFEVFGIPFTILEAMVLISFVGWFLKNYKQIIQNLKIKFSVGNCKLKSVNCKLNRYPFDTEIILLLVVSFASVVVSGFSDSALGAWKAYFFEPALLYILILNVFQGEKGLKKILWSLLVSVFAVSVLAIYQKFTGAFIFNEFWANEATRRVTSFFGYPNAVGLYLAPLVLILLGWFLEKKRIIVAMGIVLSSLSIYFAKSEGALIGILAGLAVFGILAGRKTRLATILFGLVSICGIMVYAPTRDYAIDKITLNDLSGQVRKVQWRETKKMLLDGRIVFGAGLANYKQIVVPYHDEGFFVDNGEPDFLEKVRASAEYRKKVWQPLEIYLYPHNIFLNFWSEIGIFGVILFVWIIGKYFYMSIRNLDNKNNRYLILGFIGAMIVLVIHGLVDVPYFKNDLAVMFWIMVATLSLVDLSIKNDSIK